MEEMKIKKSLYSAFLTLNQRHYMNVQGCHCFDSKKEGPTVGITVMTHGNEPAGLAAYRYFVDGLIKPERGKVIFILNNLRAANNYFNCFDTIEFKREFRFLDTNLNRLPENCLDIKSNSYEINRLKELFPVYKSFDFGLDIHSTETDSQPTIINISDDLNHGLFRGFPTILNRLISNMANIQKGVPACNFFGGLNNDIPILGIETGTHLSEASLEMSVSCVIQFCKNCGVIVDFSDFSPKKFRNYRVIKSVFFPDDSFYTVRSFSALEPLKQGEILGQNLEGEKIFCPTDCLTLFGKNKNYKSKSQNDEVFFLTDYPDEIQL